MMVHDGSSSPEAKPRKRRARDDDDSDRGSKRRHIDGDPLLKVLVPDYAAGALLGKGGSCLTEILDENGGVVRLSKKDEYYPNTNERIIMMSGQSEQIIKLNTRVMEKVRDPGYVVDDVARADIVKIVLTDESAGLLIGPKGKTIQDIHTTSGARLSIGVQCQAAVRGERICTITGSFDQLVDASRQVIQIIADEPTNVANSTMQYFSSSSSSRILPMSYGGPGGSSSNSARYGSRGSCNGRPGDRFSSPPSSRRRPRRHSDSRPDDMSSCRRGGRRASYEDSNEMYRDREQRLAGYRGRSNPYGPGGRRRGGYQLQIKVVASMDIPDELVGGVMGRQGCVIKELAHRCGGARFKFADHLCDNGEDRTLTISGGIEQLTAACELVADRVEELTDPSVSLKSAR